MTSRKAPRILYVRWVDAATSSHWQSLDEPEGRLLRCETVGFVVKETEDALSLAGSHSIDNRRIADVTTIPKSCITMRRRVRS